MGWSGRISFEDSEERLNLARRWNFGQTSHLRGDAEEAQHAVLVVGLSLA